MLDFLENYHTLKDEIRLITFSTLFDWLNGVQLLLGLFLPITVVILVDIVYGYRIEDSWTNIGKLFLFQLAFSVFCAFTAYLLSKNRYVQRIVIKRISKSEWRFLTAEEEFFRKALVYLS